MGKLQRDKGRESETAIRGRPRTLKNSGSCEDETAPLSVREATQALKHTLGNFLIQNKRSESHTNTHTHTNTHKHPLSVHMNAAYLSVVAAAPASSVLTINTPDWLFVPGCYVSE